jgi:multisubunit Na+/H+ antiporter MnhG subunit
MVSSRFARRAAGRIRRSGIARPVIYHLSLHAAGIAVGVFLVLVGLLGFLKPDFARAVQRFPRSHVAGVILLTVCLLWTFWLLYTIQMGEFSSFRRPLLIALPIGYALVLRFVDEFLAVRALGILCLLAAEPLLDAAFLRYETSRLLITVFAYVLIVSGLFWVAVPYVLRDQINWSTRSVFRWRCLNAIALIYGGVILTFAFTQY